MKAEYYAGNRARLYEKMKPGALLVLFAGEETRKTNDEYYPFFADRNFYYLTGIGQRESILLAMKQDDTVEERLYVLPKDAFAERWSGRRISTAQAEAISGVKDIRVLNDFEKDFRALTVSGQYECIYLDLYRYAETDALKPSHHLAKKVRLEAPYLRVENANILIRRLRLIKQPCEIEAIRRAEVITGEGILAMMKASRPGMYEYQYRAEFDRALAQHGPEGPGFPSIISVGANNFCIHYYSCDGQAQDGDMVLNDVGAQWDGLMTDVSRGWPCSGRYSDRQKVLYSCALATSNHMFSILKPGYPMKQVDAEIRRYNAERLKDAGVLKDVGEIGTYMWHGGAHHVGYDVHDAVEEPEVLAPGMVFCVDVGIYHEEWGIGFRVEDNCLVTEDGCENLSAAIPRNMDDIEDIMRRG